MSATLEIGDSLTPEQVLMLISEDSVRYRLQNDTIGRTGA